MRLLALVGLPRMTLLGFVVATLCLAAPLLRAPDAWGILDWDQHTFHHAVAREALLAEGDFPLWNPYYRSGVPLLANPESRVLAPSFPIVLGFGAVVGLKLEIVLHLLLALIGMHALLRHVGVSPVAATAGSFVFAFDGWIVVHLTVGHVWALNAAYVPWLVLCMRRSAEDRIWVLPTAALLAVMFLGGGVYPLVIAGFVLAALVLGEAGFSGASLRRRVSALALVVVLALPLAAVKLLPSVELMQRHPRTTAAVGGYTGAALLHALVDRDQALLEAWRKRPEEFNGTLVHESLYVGVLPLFLAFLGIVAGGRRAAPWCVAGAVCLWLSLGATVWPSPWTVLHPLPVFDQLRMPQRFGLGAVLAASILASIGLDALVRRVEAWTAKPVLARGLALACSLVIACDLVLVGARTLSDAFPIPPIPMPREAEFRQYEGLPPYDATGFSARPRTPFLASLGALYPAFLAHRGSTIAYEIVPGPTRARAVGSRDYRGEAWLAESAGAVRTARWLQNRLEIELSVAAPDRLVINQNVDPGWRVVEPSGRVVEEAQDGLLSVAVTPEDRRVVLVYRPTSFVVGAWLSGIGWIAIVGVWLSWRRRAHGAVLASGGPHAEAA
ncbi:MAG: hypothetical protein R3F16_21785 [Myxococcota bacterium]